MNLGIKEVDNTLKQILADINPKDGVDVSTVLSEVEPNRYFCFRTGGPHFFGKCENKEKVRKEYLENIWPFVYHVKGYGRKILTGTISKGKASIGYPMLKMYHVKETRSQQDFRQVMYKKVVEKKKEIEAEKARIKEEKAKAHAEELERRKAREAIKIPFAPLGAGARATKKGAVVWWTPGSDGGKPVTKYHIVKYS